ncbi:MAG: nucleoside-diphosphate kinase [Acidobacteria bacterium]|nr:nucleoside-diphosphate kinase [Acidobacteriota bacterium]
MDKKELEQTLVLLKPDALKNSLTGYLLSQLSEFHSGLHFAGARIVAVNRILAEEHYAEHRGKAFYESLLDYITGRLHWEDEPWKRRVVAIVYQGADAIRKIRDIAGPTNPHVAREDKPGCIRALGTLVPIKDTAGRVISDRMDNLIHASANPADAEREIKLWFTPGDIPPMMHAYETEICDAWHGYADGRLFTQSEPGAICLFAPGDVAWRSDLETLRRLAGGLETAESLNYVAAKYLINDARIR